MFSTLKGMTGEHKPKRSCGRRLTCYKKAGTLKLSKTGPQILAPPQPAVRPWPHFVPVQMKLLLYRIENELMYAKDSARRLDTVKLKKRFLSEWGQPRESGNCCPDRASVGRGNAKVFSFIFPPRTQDTILVSQRERGRHPGRKGRPQWRKGPSPSATTWLLCCSPRPSPTSFAAAGLM